MRVSATAMPLLVLALTGSGLAMGIVGAISTGADFVMGTIAGALADRGDRKRMMFVADLGRAVFTALIPLSVFLHGPTMAVILLVAAPLAVFRGFFRAGYLASMPNLVGRSQLARGNGILETAFSAAFIVGPAIAGFLVTVIGPGPTLARRRRVVRHLVARPVPDPARAQGPRRSTPGRGSSTTSARASSTSRATRSCARWS